MAKQNKYLELLELINKLNNLKDKCNESIKKQISDLMTIIEMDKLAKIIILEINESEITNLITIVNETIAGYLSYLDNLVNSNTNMMDFNEYKITKEKIDELNRLKDELEEISINGVNICKNRLRELTNKYLSNLIEEVELNPDLFNKLDNIVKIVGEEELYKALEDDNFYSDLKKCLKFEQEKRRDSKIYDLCEVILSYKSRLEENIDKLIAYNTLNKSLEEVLSMIELSDKDDLEKELEIVSEKDKEFSLEKENVFNFNKYSVQKNSILKKLDSYNELFNKISESKKKIKEVNKKLIQTDLGNLLFGLNTNLRLSLNKSEFDLSGYLQDIEEKEDLELFFDEIEDVYHSLQARFKGKYTLKEKILKNSSNSVALEICNLDLELAKLLIKLSEKDKFTRKYPSLRILELEMLLAMRNTNLEDMNVNKEEVVNMKNRVNNTLKNRSDKFLERYFTIINSDLDNMELVKESIK